MPLVRDYRCGACGAPRTSLDDAMFVACEFCGAVLDAATSQWLDPARVAATFARAHAAAFWATKAGARFQELSTRVAAEPTDGPRFRALAEEQHYLYTLVYPDRVPAHVIATPRARAAWAASTARTTAAVRFEPRIAALWDDVNTACRAFGQIRASADDMVAAARTVFARATLAFAALQQHADTAADYPAPAAHYARMTVRTSLGAMLGAFEDPAIYDRVATEVLGDRQLTGDECTRCGAPLDAAARDTLRCAHCGGVLERLADDPWVRAKLGVFAAALPELHRTGGVDSYVSALALFHAIGAGAYEKAGADRIARLVARAVPWLPAAELATGAQLARTALATDAARQVLDGALAQLAPWTPDPARRPAPPPPPEDAFDADAWLAKARWLWSLTGDHSIAAAFSIAVTDVLVAQPNARPPITADLVERFFAEALPAASPAELHAAVAPLAAGYASTPAGPLAAQLLAKVAARL